MNNYRFAHMPSNDSVASLVTLLVCAWFTAAAGAILAEPSVEQQARLQARTPEVSVRQLSVTEATQPDARFTVHVVAKRLARVS
jgi:hypothetical protein